MTGGYKANIPWYILSSGLGLRSESMFASCFFHLVYIIFFLSVLFSTVFLACFCFCLISLLQVYAYNHGYSPLAISVTRNTKSKPIIIELLHYQYNYRSTGLCDAWYLLPDRKNNEQCDCTVKKTERTARHRSSCLLFMYCYTPYFFLFFFILRPWKTQQEMNTYKGWTGRYFQWDRTTNIKTRKPIYMWVFFGVLDTCFGK